MSSGNNFKEPPKPEPLRNSSEDSSGGESISGCPPTNSGLATALAGQTGSLVPSPETEDKKLEEEEDKAHIEQEDDGDEEDDGLDPEGTTEEPEQEAEDQHGLGFGGRSQSESSGSPGTTVHTAIHRENFVAERMDVDDRSQDPVGESSANTPVGSSSANTSLWPASGTFQPSSSCASVRAIINITPNRRPVSGSGSLDMTRSELSELTTLPSLPVCPGNGPSTVDRYDAEGYAIPREIFTDLPMNENAPPQRHRDIERQPVHGSGTRMPPQTTNTYEMPRSRLRQLAANGTILILESLSDRTERLHEEIRSLGTEMVAALRLLHDRFDDIIRRQIPHDVHISRPTQTDDPDEMHASNPIQEVAGQMIAENEAENVADGEADGEAELERGEE